MRLKNYDLKKKKKASLGLFATFKVCEHIHPLRCKFPFFYCLSKPKLNLNMQEELFCGFFLICCNGEPDKDIVYTPGVCD